MPLCASCLSRSMRPTILPSLNSTLQQTETVAQPLKMSTTTMFETLFQGPEFLVYAALLPRAKYSLATIVPTKNRICRFHSLKTKTRDTTFRWQG